MPIDVYTSGLTGRMVERIESSGGRVRSPDDPPGRAPAVFFWTQGFPRRAIVPLLNTHPDITWVHSIGAGADHTIPLVPSRLVLTRGPGPAGTPVGEFAVTAVLMLCRRMPQLVALHHARTWAKIQALAFAEARVAILGFGPIGQTVTRHLHQLGLTVEVVRRVPEPDATPVQHPTASLARVLSRSTGLVVACALTPDTAGILDGRMLGSIPPGGFVVNVARGGLIDHLALAELLSSGHLGGAVLDTTEPEPLPEGHPLWSAPNCLVTSHTAAYAGDFSMAAVRLFCDNLRRFAAGLPLAYVVNRELGY
jgi:phosphoglycerate dehydrogenase-like enzyme